MVLKNKQNRKKNKKSNFFKYYFFITVSILMLSTYTFFSSEMWGYYKLKINPRLNAHGILNYTKLPEIFLLKIQGHFIKKNKIFLEINFENLSKIENQRDQVIKETKDKGRVDNITFKFNEYKAKLNVSGKKIPVKIRLKGDRQIHWKDKKKSERGAWKMISRWGGGDVNRMCMCAWFVDVPHSFQR